MGDIEFSYNNKEQIFLLPVLPEKLLVKEKGNNKNYDLNNLGEVTIIKAIKEPVLTLEGFFPKGGGPYVSSKLYPPMWYIDKLKFWRNSGHPIRFRAVGFEIPINMACSIENLEYWENAGEPGDIYYKIELKEYRFRTVKRIMEIPKTDGTAWKVEVPVRPDERVKPDSYTAKPDDSLYHICRRQFGEDGHILKVAKKNGINDPNRIYPGQVIRF